jgi:hypothetical protein
MNKAEEYYNSRYGEPADKHERKFQKHDYWDMIDFAEQYDQQREKPELINETYYLVLTVKDKWGIAFWKDKWWDSPEQDFGLAFGIKDEWIKTWYNLPYHKTNSDE